MRKPFNIFTDKRFIVVLIVLLVSFILLFYPLKRMLNISNDSSSFDHWETRRTINIYKSSRIVIDAINNEFEVKEGVNKVLTVSLQSDLIVKNGKKLDDAYSSKTLLIELNPNDSIVTANTSMISSRIYRQLINFSPDYGIKPLDKNEKITLTKLSKTKWKIKSEVIDFEFNAELSFEENQVWMDKFDSQ